VRASACERDRGFSFGVSRVGVGCVAQTAEQLAYIDPVSEVQGAVRRVGFISFCLVHVFCGCVHFACDAALPAQIDNATRWRRLRGVWLCATVGVSLLQQTHEHCNTKRRRVDKADVAPVQTFLHDARMLGHDDGEGRPLRYLSWFGGMVTRFL
jgi:hypothetical protein